MPQFFATTAKGLIDPLMEELGELDFKGLEKTASGVMFETNWRGCYRANLESRLASRILKPLLDFPAYQPEDIYSNLRKHDFTKYIRPDQSLVVDASVQDCMLRDQRYVAMKAKDAIVDQFREKFEVRPNIDKERADLRIWIRGYKNRFHVSLDTSGASLNQRGYRRDPGDAPLKENLAAGLIRLTEWDMKTPLVDPMCGSGTLLIEAALMLSRMAPGSLRTQFGFQKLKGFNRDEWDEVVSETLNREEAENEAARHVREREREGLGTGEEGFGSPGAGDSSGENSTGDGEILLYGFDENRKMIQAAKENARRAGVDHLIRWRTSPVATLESPVAGKGILVTNPPYAIRMGDEDNLRDVYRDLSFTMRSRFSGWTAWVLSGNRDLISDLKLKSSRKIFVYNGAIECRFLRYDIR